MSRVIFLSKYVITSLMFYFLRVPQREHISFLSSMLRTGKWDQCLYAFLLEKVTATKAQSLNVARFARNVPNPESFRDMADFDAPPAHIEILLPLWGKRSFPPNPLIHLGNRRISEM